MVPFPFKRAMERNVVVEVNERAPPDGMPFEVDEIAIRGELYKMNDEKVVPLQINVPVSTFTTVPFSVSVPSSSGLINIEVSVSVALDVMSKRYPFSGNVSITTMLKVFNAVDVLTENIALEDSDDVTWNMTEVFVAEALDGEMYRSD